MRKSFLVRSAAAVLAAFLAGCASTQSTHAPQATGDGQSLLQQALAREATLPGAYTADADGFFSATVAASAAPVVQAHEGVYQVTVPIATEVPAECFVYHDALDSAATLTRLIEEPLADMPRTEIIRVDAGVFGKVPYLYQERLYITADKIAGVLKVAVMPFESSLLACMHDSAGYRETFTKMVASFANSLELRSAPPAQLVHEEVLLWQLRDMNIGYTVNRAGNHGKGEIRSTIETAMIVPRSASETMAHDEYNVTYEQANGELINGRYAEAENGTIKVSLNVDRTGEGGYQVSGTFQGKEISAPLQAAAGVDGPYYQHRQIVQAAHPANGRPRAVRVDAYVPSASPLETIEMDVNPTGAEVDGLPEYEMLFAGLKATGVVDAQGQKSMTVEMGPLQLQLSRVWIDSH